jgi:hypothetical protein
MEPVPALNGDPAAYLEMACEFLDQFYDAKATNAFIFSSHCWQFFIRPWRKNIDASPLVQHLEQKCMHFKFILFDCCNTSCVETIHLYRNVTDYLVGCQSACPGIGFLTKEFSEVLSQHSASKSWPSILKNLTAAFLKRNDGSVLKRDEYETDCVVLDTQYANEIPQLFDSVVFYRDQNARTQPTYAERTIFDVVTLVSSQEQIPAKRKKDIIRWVRRTVLSYKQSKLMKTKTWAHKLHGISLILNREKVTKHFL